MQHLIYEKWSNVEDHEVNNWFMVAYVRRHEHFCFYFMIMQHLSYEKWSNVEDHEINNCDAFMIPYVSKMILFFGGLHFNGGLVLLRMFVFLMR